VLKIRVRPPINQRLKFKANPSRGGDAKLEVSTEREIARPPAPIQRLARGSSDTEVALVIKNSKTQLASAALSALAVLAMVPGTASAHKSTVSHCNGTVTQGVAPDGASTGLDEGLVCVTYKGNGDLKFVLDYVPSK
jgi:hypothetical protein